MLAVIVIRSRDHYPEVPLLPAQLSVGPGETKNCNLLLGPVAGGIGIGLPGGGSVGSVIGVAVSV